jgi:hypothetical protein
MTTAGPDTEWGKIGVATLLSTRHPPPDLAPEVEGANKLLNPLPPTQAPLDERNVGRP